MKAVLVITLLWLLCVAFSYGLFNLALWAKEYFRGDDD